MALPRSRPAIAAIAASLALLTAACGGGDNAESSSTTSTSSSTSSTTSAPDSDAPTDADTPEVTEDAATSSTTSTSTTTSAPVSNPPPPVELDDIPGLIVQWGEGTGDPLDLARRLIGFPIEIDVPDGSTPHTLSVILRADSTEPTWRWEWSYEVISSQPIGDIDAELPEGGPGTIETRLTYDPVMEALGWRNTGQVISDPSSGAGGPQSVNFVYQLNAATFPLGGVGATPVVARVWAEEDMIFGHDRQPGYEIEITLDSVPDLIPVPMLDRLSAALPVAPGAQLIELRFSTRDRPADSFAAAEGLRYIDLEYTYRLAPGSGESARAIYSTGLDGTTYQPGEESFFDDGFIEETEPAVTDTTWTQQIVVLDRYPGEISIIDDPATGGVISVLEMRLEPNRELLQPLTE